MTSDNGTSEQDQAQDPVAGTSSASGAPLHPEGEVTFDSHGLVADVARRIAESLRAVEAPVPTVSATETTTPFAAAEPENAETVAQSVHVESQPTVGFDYVPAPDDRIATESAAAISSVRIEPSFDVKPASPQAEPGAATEFPTPGGEPDLAAPRDHSVNVDPASPAVAIEAVPRIAAISSHPDIASRSSEPRVRGASIQDRPYAKTRAYAGKIIRGAGYALGGYLALVLFLIAIYRYVNPPASTLMVYQWLTGRGVTQTWVPIERISPQLVRAVVVSEDWRFCEHNGIDLDAIEEAIEKAGDGIPRGASTISMQVTKNLFLSQSKSYVRKAIEIPLTLLAEIVWPKSRMLEIYLNIAEWAPGVFGAEAAAQHHFQKSARNLGEREAALLAASLPNPRIRDAGDPGPRTARKASVIQSRMRIAGPVAGCVLTPSKPQKADKQASEQPKKRAGASLGL